MAECTDILARTEYRNWMKCSIAQNIFSNVSRGIVTAEIDCFQKDILQNVQYSKKFASSTTCNQCQTPNLLPCPTPKLCHLHRNKCSFHNGSSLQRRQCPTHGLCDDVCNEIINTHRFRGPSWKNTDSSKWCTIAWTIAKCFMPTDGYTNVTSASETDFNGLINIVINCVRFQRHFKDDLSQRSNTCTKVRDCCKGLRHSPTLNMTDDEMNIFIDTLVGILNDPVFMHIHHTSSETSRKLAKVKTDTMDISATDMNCILYDAKQSMKAVLEALKKESIVDLDTEILTQSLQTIKDIHNIIDDVHSRIRQALSESTTLYCSWGDNKNYMDLMRNGFIKQDLTAIQNEVEQILKQAQNK